MDGDTLMVYDTRHTACSLGQGCVMNAEALCVAPGPGVQI